MNSFSSRRIKYLWSLLFSVLPGVMIANEIDLKDTHRSLEFVSYNAYNLFDTEHDVDAKGKDKHDGTYLPESHVRKIELCMLEGSGFQKKCEETDWTKEKYNWKVKNLATAITRSRKISPDVIGLVEVEKIEALKDLAKELEILTAQKYEAILHEGPDGRGIDVGLLYNPSEFLQMKSHNVIPVSDKNSGFKPTRDILEVEFLLNKKESLFVYVNHWPSQLTEDSNARIIPAKKLMERVMQRTKENPKSLIVALGDFNVIPSENPHPFDVVSPHVNGQACQGFSTGECLFDVHEFVSKNGGVNLAPGTFYFTPKKKPGKWNLLDHFFVNQVFFNSSEFEFRKSGYTIVDDKFLRKEIFHHGKTVSVPFRTNINATSLDLAGFSDHFPIYLRLDSKN